MKAFIGLCGLLVFMTLTSAAEQRDGSGTVIYSGLRLPGIQTRTSQVNVTVRTTTERRGVHSASLSAAHQTTGIAPAKSPSFHPLAPIPPMGPLFPEDDLQRIPWASFGFHRASARGRVHTAAVTSRTMVEERKVMPPAALEPPPDTQGPPPVERASFDRPTSNRATAWRYPLEETRPHESFTGHGAASGISPERAKQIQAALIQHGYLAGVGTGTWDPASVAAMRRLQADHGWQTKLAPDARALIFLGLGPGSATP